MPLTILLCSVYATFLLWPVAFGHWAGGYYYFLVAICWLCSAALVMRSRWHTLLYMQFLVFMLVGHAVQTYVGVTYFVWGAYASELTLRPALIFALHMIFITLAASVTSLPTVRDDWARWRPSTVLIAICGMVVVVACTATTIGLQPFLLTRAEIAQLDYRGEAALIFLEFTSKATCYVLAAALVLQRPKNFPGIVGTIVALGVAVLIANPMNTARFVSLSGFVLVAIAGVIVTRRTHWISFMVLLAPLAMLLVLPITSSLRSGFEGLYSMGFEMMASLEFSALNLLIDAAEFFRHEPMFSNYTASALLVIVPRSIWPGKADAFDAGLVTDYGYVIEGVAVPSFFVFQADYGYVGMMLASIAMGYMFTRLQLPRDGFDFRRRRSAYGLIIFALMPIIARGDLSTAMVPVYAFATAYEIVRFMSLFVFGGIGEARQGYS